MVSSSALNSADWARLALLGIYAYVRAPMEVPLWPTDTVTLSEGYVLELAGHFFPPGQEQNALAIAHCESRYNTHARNTRGEDSRGLFQINIMPNAWPALAKFNLADPITNTYWAAHIYQVSGNSWHPWYNCAKALKLIDGD